MTTKDSPTAVFFDRLGELGRVPMLGKINGSLLAEVVDGRKTEQKKITVRRGKVSVGPPEGDADCSLQADRRAWDAMVTQASQPLPMLLRGAVVAAGDPAMLVLMRRLFAVAGVPELAPAPAVAAVAGRGRL